MSVQALSVDFMAEAATALEQLAKITGRSLDEVLSDAINTFYWLLREQASGRRIVSMDGDPDEVVELAPLIRDHFAASQYFAQ